MNYNIKINGTVINKTLKMIFYGLLDIGSKICHYKYIKCEKCPVNNYCLFSI